jgi:hypothetical protein
MNETFEAAWEKFQKAMAKRAIRTMTQNEARLIWDLILELKPKAMLELGGQHGHSGLIFSDAMKQVGGLFITVELGNDPENHYPPESCGTLEFLPDNDPSIIKVWGNAEKKLPELLRNYPIELVFHDCAHTWDHVEFCVKTILDHDPKITQMCHDCAEGMWQPERETKYGYICAERPVFDKYFLNNPNYNYRIFEEKYGVGIATYNGTPQDTNQ